MSARTEHPQAKIDPDRAQRLIAEPIDSGGSGSEQTGSSRNGRRYFAEAQADSLARQLSALRDEYETLRTKHEALTSSLAWRLVRRIHEIGEVIGRWRSQQVARGHRGRPEPRPSNGAARMPAPDFEAARLAYLSSPISAEADTFVLYRIIGNDLPPRHRKGQAYDNVAFILENEPELEACEKRWIVNRVFDKDAEAAIVNLLERHGQRYVRIPFNMDEYALIDWELEDFPEPAFFLSKAFHTLDGKMQLYADLHARWRKNAYVMNNNGARNAALADGRNVAKWILPWDGNCFISATAWHNIRRGIFDQPFLRYFVVPMARVPDNSGLHDERLGEMATEEPQIVFRRDAGEIFDDRFVYGRRSKVEMLVRLGVPGKWDRWPTMPWEAKPRPALDGAGEFATVGWVARLGSGMPELEVGETSFELRGDARAETIRATIDILDQNVLARTLGPVDLAYYDETALDALAAGATTLPLADQLLSDADDALSRGPYSVVDKTTLPPSGDLRDYWHLSPYYWPNPDTANGLPYIKRDGQRLPGTELYAPDSERFDRTRLQRLFDDTTVLALAWRVSYDDRYSEHAAQLIRKWFIEPDTKMNPHLRFAQVRLGHNNNKGNESGVIEFKDIYYFLDAVRLTAHSGALSDTDLAAFRSWMRTYLAWLESSPQGRAESRRPSIHGTMYEVQVSAIARFLEKPAPILKSFRRARQQIQLQFDPAGAQPLELARTRSRHHCAFNLQGWTILARIAAACGDDLWSYTTSDGRGIGLALDGLIKVLDGGNWPYADMADFDEERLEPLRRDFDHHYGGGNIPSRAERFSGQAIYHPTCGIAPYWMLARHRSANLPQPRLVSEGNDRRGGAPKSANLSSLIRRM